MIYCPQCGTPNKPNSKFCKNCAAPLQAMSEIRCPICDTPNPHDAASCKNCGTRLIASSAGSGAPKSSPADAPENITPYNPPELSLNNDAPVESSSAPRPTFSRSNSEWLRRIGKAPTESQPNLPPAPENSAPEISAAAAVSAAAASADDSSNWLEERKAETDAQAKANEPTEPAVPAKPQLSEIKLTGDDYDYSDIGGQVTDEMKAQLEAEAGGAQSVDDEVELMRRLLGLSAAEAVASAPQQEQPKPVVVETPAPAQTVPESITASTQVAPAAEMPQETVAPATSEPVLQISELPAARTVGISQPEESDNDLLVKLAAASSAAVAAKLIQDDTEKIETPTEQETAQPVEPPAIAPPLAVPVLAADELPPTAPMLSGDNLPEWLSEITPPELTEADLAHSESPRAQEVDEFSGMATLGAAALAANLADLDESEREDLPDWLREPIVPASAAASEEIVESLEQAEAVSPELPEAEGEIAPELQPELPIELPEWMRAGAPPPRETFEIVETTGPLAGVSGILPLALALTEPHTLSTATPARGDGGRIFQTLLAQPLAGTAETKRAAPRTSLVSTKHILYLLILAAALFALLLPAGADELGLLGKDVVNSPSAVFYDQLNALPQASTVLLTFDYAPGQSPELDPAARVILENLAARQVNVIALSTNPNGATIAQTLLERARETQPKFTFVNLGYIPGNEAGLKRLALGWLPVNYTDTNGVAWGQSPLAKNIRGMDDLALNILILGDNSILNVWMMQVQPIIKSPMVAATTAAIYPQARMFVDANQLRASLRGLTGAAELELWSGISGRAVKSVNALSFVSLVLAGIIVVTNIAWLMRRNKK